MNIGEERIILRQLKAAFAKAKLEQFLSEMIDCQLIIRENRQYRLNFPIYTAAEVAVCPWLKTNFLSLKEL